MIGQAEAITKKGPPGCAEGDWGIVGSEIEAFGRRSFAKSCRLRDPTEVAKPGHFGQDRRTAGLTAESRVAIQGSRSVTINPGVEMKSGRAESRTGRSGIGPNARDAVDCRRGSRGSRRPGEARGDDRNFATSIKEAR